MRRALIVSHYVALTVICGLILGANEFDIPNRVELGYSYILPLCLKSMRRCQIHSIQGSPTMSKYELVIGAGPLEGQRVRLDNQQTLLLGRTPRGLNLPDPQVSPKHAEISWSGDRFWIVDLDSATGTVVNGRRVGREPLALHPGMRIEIGESIRDEDPPDVTELAVMGDCDIPCDHRTANAVHGLQNALHIFQARPCTKLCKSGFGAPHAMR